MRPIIPHLTPLVLLAIAPPNGNAGLQGVSTKLRKFEVL